MVLIKGLAGSSWSVLMYYKNLHLFVFHYGISYNTPAKEDIPQKALRKIPFALRHKRRNLQNLQLFGLTVTCREVFGNSPGAGQEYILFETRCSGNLQPHKISVLIEHQLGRRHKSFGTNRNPQIICLAVVGVNSKSIKHRGHSVNISDNG